MPAVLVVHDEDPAQKIWREAGNLDEIEIFNNQVLVGVYLRPEKMSLGGREFYMPDKSRDEDKYQSKLGLILKIGPTAFQDPNGKWFAGEKFSTGEWIVFRPSDGWNITLISFDKGKKTELLCRLLDDVSIRGRVSGPSAADRVY